MTFEELNRKHGGGLVASEWSQHKNGGGWVQSSASVEASAYVGPDAQVYGNARVHGNAQVSGTARVYGDAQVSGTARVYGDAQVSGNARVSGNAWKTSPLYIQGSRFALTNCRHGYLQIGCRAEKFGWWKTKAALAFAKENGFSAAEVSEYREYVKLFCKLGK